MDMKKTITLVLLIFAGMSIWAQDCNFKVRFTVTPATCYNNGKVAYALIGENGEPVSDAAEIASLRLSQVRIYHKANISDTSNYSPYYTGGWDTLVIDHGTHIIGVEGLCEMLDGNHAKVDTHLVMEIPTTYATPVVESFSNIATSDAAGLTSLGMRPTIECGNTGVVQLKILDGSFPFTVTIKDHTTGNELRTDTITQRQYDGYYEYYYNYKDYYSIENLPAGNWEFHIEDGCGYKMPVHTQSVTVVQHPKFTGMYQSSIFLANFDTYADENSDHVLRLDVYVNNDNNDYYQNRYNYNLKYLKDFSKYRFNYGGGNYSEWRPVIGNGHEGYGLVSLYDTIRNTKLCDLLGKNVILEYKDECLGTTETRTFEIYRPIYRYSRYNGQYDTTLCDLTPLDSYINSYTYSYYYNNGIYSYIDNYASYQYDYSTNKYKYAYEYFKDSLEWRYTDLNTGNTFYIEKVDRITTGSYLHDSTVARVFGLPCTLDLKRELVSDVCGVLMSETRQEIFTDNMSPQKAYWNRSSSYNSPYYCENERYVYVYSYNFYPKQFGYDSTIVRLVRSPYNNFYNFEAVYDNTTMSFRSIKKDNMTNTATIRSYDGTSFYIQDMLLPSGPYQWQIITPCDTYELKQNAGFPDLHQQYWIEEPTYELTQDCTRGYITYNTGKLGFHRWNTSYYTGNDTIRPDYIPPTTCFRVINGPAGGYDATNRYYKVGEPMPISMNGKYVIETYYSAQTESPIKAANYDLICQRIYDTIDFNLTNTVEFDYAVALLCEPLSTTGNIYVKGKNGELPYTYTLYRGTDTQGEVIGVNNTGKFFDVDMEHGEDLLCLVQDQCGASFPVSFKPKVWTDLQKVWFDNGLKVSTTCEGSTICVNAISIGDILHYNWTGPNGFSDTMARSCVFLPRGSEEGWYKVHIASSGCAEDHYDSIYLHIDKAPSIEMGSDFSVCPGEPAVLEFRPHSHNSTSSVAMTVMIENQNTKQTLTLYAAPGDVATYTIYPQYETKVYVTALYDGTCEYTIVEDTQRISIKGINPYIINTIDDRVCYEDDATLFASSTIDPPYKIRWYNDYNLTQLVKEDVVSTSGSSSQMSLPGLTEDKIFYISVESDDVCPTAYGKDNHTLNMHDGTTEISIGNTYRFYDSGGPNGYYTRNEIKTHTFKSTDGKPITVRFDSYYISYYSLLYIFSGETVNDDSLILALNSSLSNPGVIKSKGDALTFYFVAGNANTTGWNAVVEHEPAIVAARVRPKNDVLESDAVCQSQTNTYSNPLNIPSSVATPEQLNNAMRHSGEYTFTQYLPGSGLYGCDSTFVFRLRVLNPPSKDTTVVITNMHHNGYNWNDSVYTKAGEHYRFIPQTNGCDIKDVLRLVVLEIDTSQNEICIGDSTDLSLSVNVKTNDGGSSGGGAHISNSTICVGDVLCTDGSTVRPEDFILSGKTAMGVVAQVDAYTGQGRAVALSGASNSTLMRWCYSGYSTINSITQTGTFLTAVSDMNGYENTSYIVAKARAQNNQFNLLNTAAYHCLYYDHSTFTTGTDSLGWYMPSAGEMQLVFSNRVEINSTLNILKSVDDRITTLPLYTHWTSTEYNDSGFDYAWVNDNGVTIGYDKWGYYSVRPLIKFTLP